MADPFVLGVFNEVHFLMLEKIRHQKKISIDNDKLMPFEILALYVHCEKSFLYLKYKFSLYLNLVQLDSAGFFSKSFCFMVANNSNGLN